MSFDTTSYTFNITVSNISQGFYEYECGFFSVVGYKYVYANWTVYAYPYIRLYTESVKDSSQVRVVASVIVNGAPNVTFVGSLGAKKPVNITTLVNTTKECHVVYTYHLDGYELTDVFVFTLVYNGKEYVKHVQIGYKNCYESILIMFSVVLFIVLTFYLAYKIQFPCIKKVPYARLNEIHFTQRAP